MLCVYSCPLLDVQALLLRYLLFLFRYQVAWYSSPMIIYVDLYSILEQQLHGKLFPSFAQYMTPLHSTFYVVTFTLFSRRNLRSLCYFS